MQELVSRQLFGIRKYREEARTEGIENTVNMIKWKSHGFYDPAFMDSVLESTTSGATYTYLGDASNAAETNGPLKLTGGDADAVRKNQKWIFKNFRAAHEFTNVGEHALFLGVYEYVATRGGVYINSLGSTANQLMYDVEQGIDAHIATGASSASSKTGQFLLGTRLNNVLETHSGYLKPYNRHIAKQWKLLKKRTIKLDPGDTARYLIRFKNYTYDISKVRGNADSADAGAKDIIPGITKGLIIEVRGPIGRSSVVGENDVVGYIKADLAVTRNITGQIVPLVNRENYTHMELGHDDLSTKTMVHPTEHSMVDDDN